VRKQNHWLDALYNACVAGHLAGVRLVVEHKPEPPPPRPDPNYDPEFTKRWVERFRLQDYPRWGR
jgi:hypothetical protein